MKTQCQMIREHLEAGHRLSPIEALNRFGCFRLASRINELRKQGLDIRTGMAENAETGKRWAEYWLKPATPFLEPSTAAKAVKKAKTMFKSTPTGKNAIVEAAKASAGSKRGRPRKRNPAQLEFDWAAPHKDDELF